MLWMSRGQPSALTIFDSTMSSCLFQRHFSNRFLHCINCTFFALTTNIYISCQRQKSVDFFIFLCYNKWDLIFEGLRFCGAPLQVRWIKERRQDCLPFFQSQVFVTVSAQLPLSSVSLLTETVWSVFIAWWCWFKSSLWPFNYTHYEAGAKCQSNFLHCMIVLLSQNRDDTKDVDPMREFANNILLSRCSEWSLIS